VKQSLITLAVVGLTALAVAYALRNVRHFHGGGEDGARVWFYDQQSRRLYSAPRDLIPPDGKNDVRVRALVVGFQGLPNDPSQLKIAYLEKYSPDFKALLERAEAARASRLPFTEQIPSPNSPYAEQNTFVKRPSDSVWQPTGSPAARAIIEEWRSWQGPGGEAPIISVPLMR